MSSSTNTINYHNQGKSISWQHNGKEYWYHGIAKLIALKLKQSGLILVVEPGSIYDPNNAVLLNSTGSEIKRITNPEAENGAICFSDAYYMEDAANLIIAFNSWQKRVVIDEYGNMLSVHESR